MNNLSSGGLAIIVVAALWFLVLLPSFIRGDQRSNSEARKKKSSSVRRDFPISLKNQKEASEPSVKNPNAFSPKEVPSQNFLRTGAIEVVQLADVIAINEAKPASEIDSLDEILRRRRHLG